MGVLIVAVVGTIGSLIGKIHPWFPTNSFGNTGEWVGGAAAVAAILALGHEMALEKVSALERRAEEERERRRRISAVVSRRRRPTPGSVDTQAWAESLINILDPTKDAILMDIATLHIEIPKQPSKWQNFEQMNFIDYQAELLRLAHRLVDHYIEDRPVSPDIGEEAESLFEIAAISEHRHSFSKAISAHNSLHDFTQADKLFGLAKAAGPHDNLLRRLEDSKIELAENFSGNRQKYEYELLALKEALKYQAPELISEKDLFNAIGNRKIGSLSTPFRLIFDPPEE